MSGKGNGKVKKKKKGTAKTGGGLLSRFFGGEKAGRANDGGAKKKPRARPLTPLERSIQEIKNMAKVGESDPEECVPNERTVRRLFGRWLDSADRARSRCDRPRNRSSRRFS